MLNKAIFSVLFVILSMGIIGLSEAFAEELEFHLLNTFDLVNQNDQIVRPTDMHLGDSGFLYTVQHFTGIHIFDSDKNLVLFIDRQNSEINPHSGLNGITADSLGIPTSYIISQDDT